MLTKEQLLAQIPHCLKGTDFDELGKKYAGKVRDNYSKEGRRIIVVTDKLSAFDRIITMIPFKGQVLNQLAQFWFEKTRDIVGNHVIEFPDPNVVVAKECKMLPVEMVSSPSSSHNLLAARMAAKLSMPTFEPNMAQVSYSGPSTTVPVYLPLRTRQMLPQHMGQAKQALSPIL